MRMFWKGCRPPAHEFKLYRLTGFRWAARVEGEFAVETREGNIAKCKDGYLVLDSDGFLHPVAREEFEKVYEETQR